MNTLARIPIVVLSAFLLVAPSARAASSTLEGIVKDADGHALKGAQIYIKGKEGSSFVQIVKTDANGHYIYSGLGMGPYSVSLVVKEAVKASITNVKMLPGETEKLNFDLQRGAAAKPFTKGRHYVWVPSESDSHLAGHWLEVDDEAGEMPRGMQERIRWSGNSAARQMQATSAGMRNQ